jgi:hypothetical protein
MDPVEANAQIARLSPDAFEIHLEALLQVRLECHLWKAHFIQLAQGDLPHVPMDGHRDVWDLMLEHWIPKYSTQTYDRYAPLFDEALRDMRTRFERLSKVFTRVLPRHVQKRLVRTIRQLEFASASYRWIPARAAVEDADVLFAARFKGVIRVLRLIARDADQRLAAMID